MSASSPPKLVGMAASDPKDVGKRVAEAVKEALRSSPNVWLYPVDSVHGKKEAGLVAFSRDYLQEAVAERLCADPAYNHVASGGQWFKVSCQWRLKAS